ncbi:MAG: nuclear transport factor 2 family protein [Pseudomonadota bacterium]
MSTAEKNVEMIKRIPTLIPDRLDEARDVIAEDFVWHYINPLLPQIEGDYVGVEGLKNFFRKLADLTGGTFGVRLKHAYAMGDELVVAHATPGMTLDGQTFETDAAVPWRIVDGKITEAWDIPAVYTVRMDDAA